jgi:Na+-transporting NADH:ubiquinone oxidoreductase subunit E
MAIGFMSFGGMLTGGDEEPTTEKETVLSQDLKSNPVSDKSIETVIEEDKELANNTKVVE